MGLGTIGWGGSVTGKYSKQWGNENSQTTSFNDLSQGILDQFTEMAFSNYQKSQQQTIANYSKEAALADTQGIVASSMRQLTEQQLPSLVSAEAGGGAYGSTATAALKNDAVARTAEAAARAQLEGVAQYANIQSALQTSSLQDLYQALSLQKGGTVDTARSWDSAGWGLESTVSYNKGAQASN